MKCTSCRKVIKPVVAVDIDGTLGDYHGHLLTFAENYLALPEGFLTQQNRYGGGERMKEWFRRATGVQESIWQDMKLAYRQGAMKRSMPVYPYAAELCTAVRGAGAELWLCTTRPYYRLDNVDPDTREWLRRCGIHFDGLLYDQKKYEILYEYVGEGRVVAVLDDLWYQCKNAEHEFGVGIPILRRTPYNVRDRYPMAVDSLEGAETMIKESIDVWIANHEFQELEVTGDSPRNA